MKVLVAMSGGVDSSVSAYLLKQQGYEVIGATMQVWDYSQCYLEEGLGTCCSSVDVEDARSVADLLQIPFYVINCEQKFKEKVIDPFLQSYLKGETPLPCSRCNTFLKFDYLIQKMKELNCDYLATGHYAQIEQIQNEYKLKISEDGWKDQSYFLFELPKELLPKILFPVGKLNKTTVRKIALEAGISVARKKDSTGICFVGNKNYSQFIAEHVSQSDLAKTKGVIRRYPTGEIMASHEGIYQFTIGQSRGLGMTYHQKLFVIDINSKTNEVWVGEEKYLYKKTAYVRDVSWLTSEQVINQPIRIKIRSTHQGAQGYVFKDQGRYRIEFLSEERAITPGQAAVFYKDSYVLGGGWIEA